MQEPSETWVLSLGREDPVEEGAAVHPSTLAWEIPWTEEPGGHSPRGRRTRHEWRPGRARSSVLRVLVANSHLALRPRGLCYHGTVQTPLRLALSRALLRWASSGTQLFYRWEHSTSSPGPGLALRASNLFSWVTSRPWKLRSLQIVLLPLKSFPQRRGIVVRFFWSFQF